MDLFSANPDIPASTTLPYTDSDAALHDTIASFIHMTDKMEHILPPDLNLTSIQQPCSNDEIFTPAATPISSAPPSFHISSSSLSTSPMPQALTHAPYEATTHPDPSAACIATINNAFQAAITAQANAPLAQSHTPSCSPCTVQDLSPLSSVRKRKTTRKPKTYSKPVASRFCHICSRMPRKGQGSATCRRMREGYCRKIVCEQCIREQGWDYDTIAQNPNDWLCPHCAEICPPRSQCHIYNRINARRKKVGQKRAANSVATALASSDVLMRPYAHLLEPATMQVIQPPPNFRLNLPPHYSQP
eukprot:TRINITY_DN71796_c0_g1_i1.p1 TRINITY_DN71796_c0_g1~~TRINITY_DN71796_c0_g1_i1.p1  ORF type:complete len:328 (-),score=45.35 TRINITY_DN71796_c0_g1_i1:140-1048(-)